MIAVAHTTSAFPVPALAWPGVFPDQSASKGRSPASSSGSPCFHRWGHKTKADNLADYAAIKRELVQLPDPCTVDSKVLDRLAMFLKDITVAWERANQEERNTMASCLFEVVWIKDKRVVAVTPQPDFKPFFDHVYEGKEEGVCVWRPRGDSNP